MLVDRRDTFEDQIQLLGDLKIGLSLEKEISLDVEIILQLMNSMETSNNRTRRKSVSWKVAMVSASIVLAYSRPSQTGVTAFQTPSNKILSKRIPTRQPSSVSASNMSMENERRREQESSRTWSNVQRRSGAGSTYNARLSPIPTDQSPIHINEVSRPGQGRKKMKPMPVTGYDAQSILNFYDRRPLQVGWRLNSLGFPLLGWYLGLLSDKALGLSEKPYVMRKRGKELRQHLVRSQSVALIKVREISI